MKHRLYPIITLFFVMGSLAHAPFSPLYGQRFSAPDSGSDKVVGSLGPANRQPLNPLGQEMRHQGTQDQASTVKEAAKPVPLPAPAPQMQKNDGGSPPDQHAASLEPTETEMEEGYVINFNNVAITEFIRFISKISGKNFVFDETDLQFNVTIVSEGMTSEQDVMAALLQVLQIHGLSLLEQGNNLIIYKNANISKFSTLVIGDGPEDSPVVTRVFRLNYMNPEKIRGIIQPLLSGQAIVEVSSETHHLIVTDITATIDKVAELLKVLDQPNNVIQIAAYQTKHHSPQILIELGNKILGPIAASEGATLTMVPQDETDKIFIISTPDLIERSLSTLAMLDIASAKPTSAALLEARKTEFFVYKLQYFKGDKIEQALRQVGESLAGNATVNDEVLLAINSMQWVSASNSFLFSGTPDAIKKIKELLKTLDTAPRQVFIEMLVVQTSLANSLTFNVEWGAQPTFNNNGLPVNYSGGFFQVPSQSQTTNAFGSNAGTPDFSPNFTVPSTLNNPSVSAAVPLNPGFNVGVIGNILRHNGKIYGSLGALLNALQVETYTQIIMNPKIVTTDTNTASVFVGQNTPFTTSTTQIAGAAASTGFTVDYRDVGVYLEITPLLGSGDVVTLDIHQEINDVTSNGTVTTSSGNASGSNFPIPTTNRTVTTTRVHIPDEYFLIISGMIKDQRIKTKNQFPCLGGLPLIGDAFTQQGNSHAKNNVIIFIHPRIINTPEDGGELTDEQGEEYCEKSNRSDLDPVWGKRGSECQ